jgi:hypothetical protein
MKLNTNSDVSGAAGILETTVKYAEGNINETRTLGYIGSSSIAQYKGQGGFVDVTEESLVTNLSLGFNEILIGYINYQDFLITGSNRYYVFHNPAPFTGSLLYDKDKKSTISCLGTTSYTVIKGNVESILSIIVKSTYSTQKYLYVTVFEETSIFDDCSSIGLVIGPYQNFEISTYSSYNFSSNTKFTKPICMIFASLEQRNFTYKISTNSYAYDLETNNYAISGLRTRTMLFNLSWGFYSYYYIKSSKLDSKYYDVDEKRAFGIIELKGTIYGSKYASQTTKLSNYSSVISESVKTESEKTSLSNKSLPYQVSMITVFFVLIIVVALVIYCMTK